MIRGLLNIVLALIILFFCLNFRLLLKIIFQFEEYSNSTIFYSDVQNNSADVSETELEFNYDYDDLITKLNLNNSAFFGFPFVSTQFHKHIFRSISDFVLTEKPITLNPKKVKCGDIIFVKTDHVKEFFKDFHPNINNSYILLTHESDLGVGHPWQLKILEDKKIIVWFAQNVMATHSKLKPIPIGVVEPHGRDLSVLSHLAQNVKSYEEKALLLYLSFASTSNKDRVDALKMFKNKFNNNSNVKIEENRTSWKVYLDNIKNSKFVLSPPGNGIDCIRTWEALIFGSVPIVKSNFLDPLYENLPIMIVKDWTEVTEENMKTFLRNRNFAFSKDGLPWRQKIWLRYWINAIVGTKLDYVNKYC